jgi:hypothetical protein
VTAAQNQKTVLAVDGQWYLPQSFSAACYHWQAVLGDSCFQQLAETLAQMMAQFREEVVLVASHSHQLVI